MQQQIDSYLQRQIDDIKGNQSALNQQFQDFSGEARERGAEIVGLLNTAVAVAKGDRDRLEAELRSFKLACDDNHDHAMRAIGEKHGVAMKRIDALKAERRWFIGVAITAVIAAAASMIGGWAENFFGK